MPTDAPKGPARTVEGDFLEEHVATVQWGKASNWKTEDLD